MDCPECGGSLDAYVLGGREAVTCVRCGWVGIEADHRGEPGVDESWGEALGRFYERHVETTRRPDLPPVSASADESAGGESVESGDAGASDDGRDGEASEEGSAADGASDGTSDGAGGTDEGGGSRRSDREGDATEDDGTIPPE